MSSDFDERTWTEFRDSGMLWFVNRILHVFGWAIVIEVDSTTDCVKVWPARTKVLGFSEEVDEKRQEQFLAHMRLKE